MDNVSFKMKLDLSGIPPRDRADARQEVADYLLEAVLQDTSRGMSAVTGRQWKKLSPDYAKQKKAEVGHTKPNLELSGEMLDALQAKVTMGGVEIGVYGSEAAKADGHCNHSGKSDLPLRRFIPDKGEEFRRGIMNEVAGILDQYRTGDETPSVLSWKGVTIPSESDLEDLLILIE